MNRRKAVHRPIGRPAPWLPQQEHRFRGVPSVSAAEPPEWMARAWGMERKCSTQVHIASKPNETVSSKLNNPSNEQGRAGSSMMLWLLGVPIPFLLYVMCDWT
jgi:hypothetical protein